MWVLRRVCVCVQWDACGAQQVPMRSTIPGIEEFDQKMEAFQRQRAAEAAKEKKEEAKAEGAEAEAKADEPEKQPEAVSCTPRRRSLGYAQPSPHCLPRPGPSRSSSPLPLTSHKCPPS